MHISHHAYTGSLLTLSVIAAMLASYTALDLSGRIYAAGGRARALWFVGGATVPGFGIWSMHFVGMLALHLPVAVTYATPEVVASFAVAVGAYQGMAGMRLGARIEYDAPLFWASIAIAISASFVALVIARYLRRGRVAAGR